MRKRMLSATGNFPAKILSGLLIIATFFLLSENKSLKGEKLTLRGLSDKYARLDNHEVPDLCMFTVCIDLNLNRDRNVKWAAFSYDTNSSSADVEEVELALLGTSSNMKMHLLGISLQFKNTLPSGMLIRLCCTWDGEKGLLELFQNGSKIESLALTNTTHKCLKPNGILVMGQLHNNLDGVINILSGWSFIGILHYFQMWDHIREQRQMTECFPGNVVSWQGDYWLLKGGITASALHLHCGAWEVNSTVPPTKTTAPNPAVSATTKSTGTVPTSQYGRTTSKTSRTMPTSSSSQVTTISNHDLSTQQPAAPASTPHFTITKTLVGSSKMTATTSTETETTVWPSNPSPTMVLPVSVTMATSTDSKTLLWPPETSPTVVMPVSNVTFYNVQMNFSVSYKSLKTFDYYDVKKLCRDWFEQIFFNSEFVVTNHLFKSNMPVNLPQGAMQTRMRASTTDPRSFFSLRRIFPTKNLSSLQKSDEKQELQSYSSKTIIKATSNQTVEEQEKKLYRLFYNGYKEGELSLEPGNVTMAPFAPGRCSKSITPSVNKGIFKWIETTPPDVAYADCHRNKQQSAIRPAMA